MASQLGIRIITTAAYCPFSNGLCEKNHAIVDDIHKKLKVEYPNYESNELLAWACTIKNSMSVYNGYSPYQIVFGVNPSFPGDGDDPKIPSLCEPTGEMFRKHLNMLHSARKAFVSTITSERLRRALAHKVRMTEHPLKTGDSVYYKKIVGNQWLGPATVMFQEGLNVYLKHGMYTIKSYRNRVVLTEEEHARKKGLGDKSKISKMLLRV